MRRRSPVPTLAAVLLAAVPAGGCASAARSHPDPGAVRVVLSAPAGVKPALEATLVDALGERRIGPGELRVADHGALAVRVALSGGVGEVLGAGSLSLPLDAGGSWTVEALVFRPAPGIPAPPCFGCEAEARVPLRPSAAAGTLAGDSLFLRATRTPAAGRTPPPS